MTIGEVYDAQYVVVAFFVLFHSVIVGSVRRSGCAEQFRSVMSMGMAHSGFEEVAEGTCVVDVSARASHLFPMEFLFQCG